MLRRSKLARFRHRKNADASLLLRFSIGKILACRLVRVIYIRPMRLSISRLLRYAKGQLVGLSWRWRGASIADRIVVEGAAPHMFCAGRLEIGSRVSFRTHGGRTRIGADMRAKLVIGERSFINGDCRIHASTAITIGSHCLIGERVKILDSSFHEVDEGKGATKAPIALGRNVWIANDAIILPGVSIGDHSVVAAGSIVTGSFPDRSLIAGIPARRIREISASDNYIRP